ncbi:MAG: phosphatidylserine decarboxylase [Acidobacteria bacterium]|nr:phosphatidylserine decarboxylase [Acidobacteriota bacterium]
MVITGLYYALGLTLVGFAIGYFSNAYAAVPFYILAVFCLWFFRDPERAIPAGPVMVSPADGKVVMIKPEGGRTRVAIFLNVFDVHVNRTPIAGTITKIEYHPGKFLVASKQEASTQNEQNTLTVEGDGTTVEFSQIAGLIARRIICYQKPGDRVTAGQRIGLIQFGSRVDIVMGPEWKLAVKEGDRVSAGSSVIASRVR